MARIRTIKPEFWTSEQVVNCYPTSRLLFIGTWNFADDNGVIPYQPMTLKMQIFPGDAYTKGEIIDCIRELIANDLLLLFENQGKQYLKIKGFKSHQVIKKPTKKFPEPTDEGSVPIEYPTSTPPVRNQSPTHTEPVGQRHPPEGNGMEGKGMERKGSKNPLEPSAKSKTPEYSEDFERMWLKKPPRDGAGNPKKPAAKALNARLKEGHTIEEIEGGLDRYIAHLKAAGKYDTQFTLQLVTFFGPAKHFLEPWALPKNGNGNQAAIEAESDRVREAARRRLFGRDEDEDIGEYVL